MVSLMEPWICKNRGNRPSLSPLPGTAGHGLRGRGWDMPSPQEADTQPISSGAQQGMAGLWVAPAVLRWLIGTERVAQNGMSGFPSCDPAPPPGIPPGGMKSMRTASEPDSRVGEANASNSRA